MKIAALCEPMATPPDLHTFAGLLTRLNRLAQVTRLGGLIVGPGRRLRTRPPVPQLQTRAW